MQYKVKKWFSHPKYNVTVSIIVAVVVIVSGIVVLYSRASGYFVAQESELGTIGGSATVIADTNASNGRAIKFTSASTTTAYGVPSGVALTPSGSLIATKSGQVFENLDITGRLSIPDGIQNVIVRNCRFNGNGSEWYAIDTQGSGSVTIDHVTIHGTYNDAFVGYNNVTMTNSDMYGMSNDAVKLGSNVVYKNNHVHDFRPAQGAHADGMQIFERVSNVLVQNNVISGLCDPTYTCVWSPIDAQDKSVNSAFILSDSTGTGSGGGTVTIDGNTVSGGGYTVYFTLPTSTTVFINNKFIRNTWHWGAVEDSSTATTWQNNKYTDNNECVQWPHNTKPCI